MKDLNDELIDFLKYIEHLDSKTAEESNGSLVKNIHKKVILGLDIDTIIKATGLSKEELIEKLNWKAKLVMIFSNLVDHDNEYIRSSEYEEEAKRFFNEYI